MLTASTFRNFRIKKLPRTSFRTNQAQATFERVLQSSRVSPCVKVSGMHHIKLPRTNNVDLVETHVQRPNPTGAFHGS